MKKKIIALTLLASLVLTFAACGNKTDGTSATSENSTASSSSKTSTTTKPRPVTEGLETLDTSFSDDDVDYFVVKGKAEIDGEKDEAWSNAKKVKLEQIKQGSPDPNTVVEASVMWDEDAIYFLFEIKDAQIYTAGSVGDYNNDSIYLYIAEDIEIYAPDAASYGNGAYQFALISPELEMIPRKGDTGADMNAHTAYNRTADGMIIEFSYKFTDRDLAADRMIAMDFQYNDCNDSGTRDGAYSWYNNVDGDFSTTNLAYCKLVETLPE